MSELDASAWDAELFAERAREDSASSGVRSASFRRVPPRPWRATLASRGRDPSAGVGTSSLHAAVSRARVSQRARSCATVTAACPSPSRLRGDVDGDDAGMLH